MDQKPHTLWDRIVFEDGGRKRTLVVLRFSVQEMILLFIGLLYMSVKLPPEYLNHNPYPQHPINIYTCKVTIALRICGDE